LALQSGLVLTGQIGNLMGASNHHRRT